MFVPSFNVLQDMNVIPPEIPPFTFFFFFFNQGRAADHLLMAPFNLVLPFLYQTHLSRTYDIYSIVDCTSIYVTSRNLLEETRYVYSRCLCGLTVGFITVNVEALHLEMCLEVE